MSAWRRSYPTRAWNPSAVVNLGVHFKVALSSAARPLIRGIRSHNPLTALSAWRQRCASFLLAFAILLSACSSRPPQSASTPAATPTVVLPTPAAAQVLPSPPPPTLTPFQPEPTPPPLSLWLAPYLPPTLRQSLQLAPPAQLVDDPAQAAYHLQASGAGQPLSRWVYALVAPFPTIPDGVSFQELQVAWQGAPSGAIAASPLLMDESTLGVFTTLWGTPAAGAVKILPSADLLAYAWDNQPAWAIVPFEELEPRWKVLEIDAQSPLRKEFDPQAYPLAIPFTLTPTSTAPASTAGGVVQALQPTNREPNKLTVIAMTGVTALVRATAETMRRKGILYPGQDVRDILRNADLAHVSNEIPFSPDCPLPDAWQTTLVFCSDPDYIDLLDDIGTDVVELTGDHFADWGPEAMRYTLDLYKAHNLPYYGGGYDLEDGRKPLLVEHNGNKIAFIGCNGKGGSYATAAQNRPGAVGCDFDYLAGEIQRLRAAGYLPVVTFQHFEYYTYAPQPPLVKDFHTVADAGAAIVSGSQAHQPHGLEFYNGALLHYGLGNLFFDQYHMGLPTGQGMIDRHVIYAGRHISTELLGIRFIDFARPRPMTPAERQELLESVFAASRW